MITASDVTTAIPVIISLVIIEGLLSVDNALAIAAMANHLPGRQKTLALRLGIIGAYVFRGIALAVVTWIAANHWLNILGAAYLIYLMCSHLTQAEEEEEGRAHRKKPGLLMTIVQIELMDLSLSLDNVVAAVGLAPKDPITGEREMWVVYAGVFIGILALRFLAGYCIVLLQKFPILAKTAFLLVGYVGFILLSELIFDWKVESWQKFIGVVAISAVSLLYEKGGPVRTVFAPVVKFAQPVMRSFASLLDGVFWPLRKLHEAVTKMLRRPTDDEQAQGTL
ncbi:MAG: tellurite resistance protein TerC [Verrucomicrobia bacterium]|jgi:YkoY family integral membrane protein|nr:MAG: tellurite resistance protein TerC [Verrucomicrobiota bacterium]